MEDVKKYAIGAGIAIIVLFMLGNCNNGLMPGCGARRTFVSTKSYSVRNPLRLLPRIPVHRARRR